MSDQISYPISILSHPSTFFFILYMCNLRDLPTYTLESLGFRNLHVQPTRPTGILLVGRVGCICRRLNPLWQ